MLFIFGNGTLQPVLVAALQLAMDEANETIKAIRTGQVEAMVVNGENGHELYTLKTTDQIYRVFIEKMTEGAVTLNSDGIILYNNTHFADMVNLPLSQVIGMPIEQFIQEKGKEQFYQLLERGWKNDCRGEVEIVSEQYPCVQLSLATLNLDQGFSLSIILTDRTEQKDNQQQLRLKNEELEKMNYALDLSNNDLQQFASVASHEPQEPLRKVQIFATMLQEEEEINFSAHAKEYLNKIIGSSKRMKQLITDILNYSRLSAGENVFERTNLNELLKELLTDYEILIKDKNANIYISRLPEIEVNKGQIRQVFQNIISNALKFSRADEAPAVLITARKLELKEIDSPQGDNFCLISIKDNGIGFDKKYANNIFSLFEKLNAKDKYEGTGIGLAIAKKIVEKHHGIISAKSEEGVGSEFVFIVPISQKRIDDYRLW
ncbi:MAG: PAS domain-containing protein [Taibaiella sp.]|nr:PAS domain-containing protein [Taibaiella sp.]